MLRGPAGRCLHRPLQKRAAVQSPIPHNLTSYYSTKNGRCKVAGQGNLGKTYYIYNKVKRHNRKNWQGNFNFFHILYMLCRLTNHDIYLIIIKIPVINDGVCYQPVTSIGFFVPSNVRGMLQSVFAHCRFKGICRVHPKTIFIRKQVALNHGEVYIVKRSNRHFSVFIVATLPFSS